MANPQCPSTDELKAFLLGELSSVGSDPLREHLESCPNCMELLRKLDEVEDPFLAAIRDGKNLTVDADPTSTGTEKKPPASRDVPLPSPQGIPGYEIMEELGRGGMGVVYKARQVRANRIVALKMILAGGHASSADLARFRTESEAIARQQHPNIVQVFEVGDHDGLPYFTLEFCPGGSMEKELGGTPLPPREAAVVVEQLARGMEAAHRKGILHRDLKPANVLLAEDGRRKITDFGLAKKLDDVGHTSTEAILGTPSYMAPEQAVGKSKHLGAACDIYALGAILYECLTGRPPFQAATKLDTLRQVVSEEPVPPRQLNRQVTTDLETICLKCLQKKPAWRYVTAADLADDLGRWQRGEQIMARPVGRVVAGWRWCKRNPGLVAALGAVAAFLLVGTIVSTAFAIQASDARGVAERHADAETEANKEAVTARNKAVAARNEIEEANDHLIASVARTLVRPLGLTNQLKQNTDGEWPLPEGRPPLTDDEIDTLWQLGGTPEEKLRLRFVEEALRNPVIARQLRHRAAFAVHAAVGLDAGRRDVVERLLMQRLASNVIPLKEKADLALILAYLEGLELQSARQAAETLMQAINKQSDSKEFSRLTEGLVSDSKELLELTEGLAVVAARLDAKEAAELRGQALRANTLALSKFTNINSPFRTEGINHYKALRVLSESLVALAASMEPKEGATTLTQALSAMREPGVEVLAQGLLDVTARLEPKETGPILAQAILKAGNDRGALKLLNKNLLTITERLEPEEAKEVAGILAQAIRPTSSGFALRTLAKSLTKVAVRLGSKELVATLTLAMSEIKDINGKAEVVAGLLDFAADAEPKEAKNVATILTLAASTLTQVMKDSKDPNVLKSFAQHLSTVQTRMEPQEAAQFSSQAAVSLTQAMKETKDPNVLSTLAPSLALVAGKLEPKRAVAMSGEAASAFSLLMTKTSDSNQLLHLAGDLAKLAECLEPKDAAVSCSEAAATLTKAMSKAVDPSELERLAQGLAAVAARLEPKDTAASCNQVAATLTNAMSKVADPNQLQLLAECVSAVAAHMKPKEAAQFARLASATLTERAMGTKDPAALSRLARGLAAMAARLEPKEASTRRRQAAATLIQILTNQGMNEEMSRFLARLESKETAAFLTEAIGIIPDSSENQGAYWARELNAVAARLEPEPAASLLKEGMSKTSNAWALGNMASGLAEVAKRLESKQAAATLGQIAMTIAQAMSRTSDPDVLRSLSEALAEMAGKLPREEAAALCGQAVSTLTEAVTKTSDPQSMLALARGLSALAARLEPKQADATHFQAVRIITQAMPMSRTYAPYVLYNLSKVLAEMAGKLPREEAAARFSQAATNIIHFMTKFSADSGLLHQFAEDLVGMAGMAGQLNIKEMEVAAATLTQVMGKTSDLREWHALSRDLTALAVLLEPREAAAKFPTSMSKTSDYLAFRLFPLVLPPVLNGESAYHRSQRLRRVVSSIGLLTSQSSLPLSLPTLSPALEPLPESPSAETIVDLLKHPLCIGASRRGVLDALGARYQKTFTDQWDFVRFATENKLNFDFSSPPKGSEPAFVVREAEGQPGK